jgi:hypothetical protein
VFCRGYGKCRKLLITWYNLVQLWYCQLWYWSDLYFKTVAEMAETSCIAYSRAARVAKCLWWRLLRNYECWFWLSILITKHYYWWRQARGFQLPAKFSTTGCHFGQYMFSFWTTSSLVFIFHSSFKFNLQY